MANGNDSLLAVDSNKRASVVHSLIEKSRPTSPYNLLLLLSAIIVACGLILDSVPVLIGGMMVTPMLSPILAIALGMTCGETKLVTRSIIITLKSVLFVAGMGALFGFLFHDSIETNIYINSFGPDMVYFIVALVSGVAATFAWTEEDIAEALPGVAVAVSIVPPLSAFGVGIGILNAEIIRISVLTFTLNLLGIILGSLVVFSLMQFQKSKRAAHSDIVEEEKEKEKEEESKK